MTKFQVIIDFGSKTFNVESDNKEQAEALVKQMIEQDQDFVINEDWWIAETNEVDKDDN